MRSGLRFVLCGSPRVWLVGGPVLRASICAGGSPTQALGEEVAEQPGSEEQGSKAVRLTCQACMRLLHCAWSRLRCEESASACAQGRLERASAVAAPPIVDCGPAQALQKLKVGCRPSKMTAVIFAELNDRRSFCGGQGTMGLLRPAVPPWCTGAFCCGERSDFVGRDCPGPSVVGKLPAFCAECQERDSLLVQLCDRGAGGAAT